MWLLVSAHHDDGWILFSEVKVSDPYVKTIYLSVQKIMSKAFLHLLMTGIREKEDGSKFCHCQLWLSLNTLSTIVITQLFIAPAQKGAEGPEQLSPAIEIPPANLSKDSCLVHSLLNRHHPLPTCLWMALQHWNGGPMHTWLDMKSMAAAELAWGWGPGEQENTLPMLKVHSCAGKKAHKFFKQAFELPERVLISSDTRDLTLKHKAIKETARIQVIVWTVKTGTALAHSSFFLCTKQDPNPLP